ncbi:hypothetical protein DFH06DRAFT_1342956 [Mycena polygramma]|nr:hypothetical protein DFH06DRAFT_1342956 [Mycena polygramma]
MPFMQGNRLPNDELDKLYIGVARMLGQESWSVRGPVVCSCGQPATFHCGNCHIPDLCKTCMVNAHAGSPFHNVREWSEHVSYYTPTDLYNMGLKIHFGHAGAQCPKGRPGRLEAITVGGIKTVGVVFCTCPEAWSDDDQIKAHGWWPMRANFVSALPLDVLNSFFPTADESSEAGDDVDESDSDESVASTNSSTSE